MTKSPGRTVRDLGADLLDDADELVADARALGDRVLAPVRPQVGPADAGRGDPHDGVGGREDRRGRPPRPGGRRTGRGSLLPSRGETSPVGERAGGCRADGSDGQVVRWPRSGRGADRRAPARAGARGTRRCCSAGHPWARRTRRGPGCPPWRATSIGTRAWPATLVAVRIMSRIGSMASSRPTPSSGRPSVRQRQRQHDDRAGQAGGGGGADHRDERDQEVAP